MAGEYKDQIINNIQSFFAFANESASALWKRFAIFMSDLVDIVNLDMSDTISIIENAALNHRVLNQGYYIDVALSYQEGDSLIEIDPNIHKFGYAVIDTTKQIIKQASISIENDSITLNVATTDNSGNLTPLTESQLNSFKSYYDNFTAYGIPVIIKSLEANPIMLISGGVSTISYDSVYSLSEIILSVKNKLLDIQHNAILGKDYFVNDIERQLQEIPGVRNAYLGTVQVYTGGELKYFSNQLKFDSGYFNFQEGTENKFKYEPV